MVRSNAKVHSQSDFDFEAIPFYEPITLTREARVGQGLRTAYTLGSAY